MSNNKTPYLVGSPLGEYIDATKTHSLPLETSCSGLQAEENAQGFVAENTTHFGFQSVLYSEKVDKVQQVFTSVAPQYDLMNDLMSLGVHRWWKQQTIQRAALRPGQQVLDLAGGSGDLTRLIRDKIGSTGHVVLADINAAMLTTARDRLLDAGYFDNITYVEANAEALPFLDNKFDVITMAFGLRNVARKELALESMFRVLKPGGQLLILEFSPSVTPLLQPVYDWYSFQVLPELGLFFANDRESYLYLAESIRMHPPPEELTVMIESAGFESCSCESMSLGVVALHKAYKY